MEDESSKVQLQFGSKLSMTFATILLLSLSLVFWSGAGNGLSPTDLLNSDERQAVHVMEQYLMYREREDDAGRYRLLSNAVKEELRKGGITNEKEFQDHVSAEAMIREGQIIRVQKMGYDRIKIVVKLKKIIEHGQGGIVSESLREFHLVRENNTWRVDEMVIRGGRYLP